MKHFSFLFFPLIIIILLSPSAALIAQSPQLEWAIGAGTANADFGNAIAVDAQGNVYSAGFFAGVADFDPGPGTINLSSVGYSDIFVWKTNAAGNLIWAKSIGGSGVDEASSIAVSPSGYIYITGYFAHTVDFDPGTGIDTLTNADDPCNTEIFVLKLDTAGNFIWVRSVEGIMTVCTAATDIAYGIDIDQYENVYVTGYWTGRADFNTSPAPADTLFIQSSGSTISGDIFILKIDAAGGFQWVKTLGIALSDCGYGVHVSDSGFVYITGLYGYEMDFDPGPGYDTVPGYGNWDSFILKLDPNGNYVWAIGIGGTGDDRGIAVTTDTDGNVYGTGHFSSTADMNPGSPINNLTAAGGRGAYLLKLDPSGNYLWAEAVVGNGGGEKAGAGIALDVNNNIYITGHFTESADFNMSPLPADTFILTATGAWNNTDAFIMKTDSAGNFLWAVSMGVAGVDRGTSIVVDGGNNVYTTGYFVGTVDFDPGTGIQNLLAVGSNDIYVQKLNQNPSSVNDQPASHEYSFSLYPNPASDILTIDQSGTRLQSPATITITDLNGRVLLTQCSNSSGITAVDISTLVTGMYLVTVTGENTSSVKKFGKN